MSHKNKRKRIALISPFLSGNYLGELVNSIRNLSQKFDFDLITIQTRNFNEFNVPLTIKYVDGVIVIIDAISPELAKYIISLEIPIISIGKDYALPSMEVALTNNKQGIYQAMDHLKSLGHKKIGFAGDRNIFDLELRYRAYKSYLEEHSMEQNPSMVFDAVDTFFRGGIETAYDFLDRGRPCTAMVFCTDLNAIGFQEHIISNGLKVPQDVAIVGFDNVFLSKFKSPQLSSVDQNLEQIAQYAVDRILKRIGGKPSLEEAQVFPCNLVIRESTMGEAGKEIIPEDDIKQLSQDYEEGMLANNYEAVKSIILDDSQGINSLKPLFGPFMDIGCYAHWKSSGKSNELTVDKVFNDIRHEKEDIIARDMEFDQAAFPPESFFNLFDEKNHLITVLPISIEGTKWGVFVMAGKAEEQESYACYSMFTNFMDLLAFGLEKEILIKEVLIREKKAKSLAEELEIVSQNATDGIWIWDQTSDLIEWNIRALNMLGYREDHEIRAKKHMPFYESIHRDDVNKVKKKFKAHLDHRVPLRMEFRMKTSGGDYIWIYTSGEAVQNNEGKVERIIGSVSDVSERYKSQEKIKYMAFYDSLTGLPNRAMINERLSRHVKERGLSRLAVMLLDLDRFKFINDSYGHDAGDRLLMHISREISHLLRQEDFFARFGGDEFVFLCPIESPSESLQIGERILEQLREPYKDELGFEFFASGSIGISIYPDNGASSNRLIRNADIAMYGAKHSGRNQLKLFKEEMDQTLQSRVNMENLLRRATDNNEFHLFIQPQYRISNEELIGGEVLLRWDTQGLGLIPPDEFIPMAEETGLIIPTGGWVLSKSCLLLKNWQKQYHTKITLSVNISGEQILKDKLLHQVKEALQISGLPPDSLCIEITESTAISDFEHTKKILTQLREMGVQISLDDFGTGYSSLSLLKELPLNELKIDKSFVPKGELKESDKSILKAIITLGHALGFRIVTEGIETEEQLQYLRELGCNVAQGYHCGRPRSVEEFEKLL